MDVGSPIWTDYWTLDNLDIDGYWMWVKTCQMPGQHLKSPFKSGHLPNMHSQIFKMEHGLWNLQKHVSYMTWPFLWVNPSFQTSPLKFLLHPQNIIYRHICRVALYLADKSPIMVSFLKVELLQEENNSHGIKLLPYRWRNLAYQGPGKGNNWLVVYQPLWKIWKSIGMMTFPIYGNIKKCSSHQQPVVFVPPTCWPIQILGKL